MQNRRGGDLSGDQQQLLSIARALIIKPKFLLLDEQVEGIQSNIIQQIGKAVTYLGGRGEMAILHVEQYFDFTFEKVDNFVVLRRGRVVGSGTKKDTVWRYRRRASILSSPSPFLHVAITSSLTAKRTKNSCRSTASLR